jgi:WD40 repeat protein
MQPGNLLRYSFSPDGAYLAGEYNNFLNGGGGESTLLIWRVADGALLRELATDEGVDALSWSADSRTLLAGESFGRGTLFITVE